MNLLLGVVLAFIALIIGSPLAALLLGISFTLLISSNEELILKSTGTKLLQIGIVILGLTISSSGAINLTTKYFPYISLFVIVIFLVGLIASKILKIDTKLSMLLVSGTAICGATAMVAISPLIKAKPKDLLTSLGVIFIFNAIAIAILPIIGNNIEMSSEQFGSWMALAVHDTSSVIGAAMSFNDNSVETATTLKLGRTLWLIPLIIILGVVNKDNKSTKSIFPIFVLAFILAIFAGNQLNFNEQVLAILKNISSIFLVGALFCIGTQINLKSIKVINSRIIIFALLLWLFALSAAYFLINII
tara:strand:- start:101 stop:1012 length:912 start_codon:yes stop_codon:yes gene_type:complete